MNNVKNIILVLGTTITLTGCLSGELSDDQKNAQTDNQTVIETSAISNLSEIASRIGDGFPIGAAVSESNITDTNISAIVIQHFNQVTAENIMKPEGLQPNEGDFTFDKADALVDYADDNGMAVHAHTLVWHSQSPAWMKDCTDVADCTDVMNTHITEVVQHFAGKNIASWDVVNEAFNDKDGSYRGSNETFGGISWAEKIGEDYINIAYTTARAADTSDSAAKLYYNDYNLEMNDTKLTAALTMIDGLQEDNLIDGIGFQMHVTDTFPTIENITAALKKAANTGLQVKITELDVRMNKDANATSLTAAIAETQKQRYKSIVAAYLDVVPAAQRGGITVWGISDPDSWIISLYGNIDWPLMFDADLNQKPALKGFAEALNAKTDTDSNTNSNSKNILTNGDFEAGIEPWVARGDGAATVTLETTEVHSGNNSALVEGRTATWQGISTDVVGLFRAGQTYNVSAWVKLSDNASTVTPNMKLSLEINTGEGENQYLELTPSTAVSAGAWVQLQGTYMHTIATQATLANLYVEASEISVDFYVDDISIVPEVVVPETAFFNTTFETGLDSWVARGDGAATVTLNTAQAHTGNNSALVTGRTATWNGISKDVVGLFTADETYNVSAWVRLSDDASTVTPDMKLTLEIKYGVDTVDYLELTMAETVTAGDWVELTGAYTHTITTEANEANLYVEASETTVDFYVDDISITVAE